MPKRFTASTASDSLRIDSKRPLLVCFSHLRWDFVWQRPQHLLSRAAQTYRVLVVEEPYFRDGATPHMEVSERPGGVTIAAPILPHGLSHEETILAQRDLVGRLLEGETGSPRVFWYYTPMALAFTSELDCDACVYDNMDELAAFKGASPELLALEESLFQRVDVVFTGGMSLYEAKRSRHRNVHGLPSSIEAAHFAKARGQTEEPAELRDIPHPRLGFFGVIDERMDVELVGQCADLRPDWHFVMIGPVVKIDPAGLPQRPNIHWLGGRDYKDLPRYLGAWDVGFMPFAINEATRFISPTKTPEFLAAGLPVVSTPITDVVRPYGERGFVEIAMTPLEVVPKVEGLMARSPEEREAWLARVDRHLAAGSWDKTWAAMDGEIAKVLGDEPPARQRARAGTVAPAYAATPAE
ncbi:glycosyltransferase family 1 protein [Salinarimonas soli]|uniref:Glycosyltransferase family 1 protein n=1 Tax=Salinarimonas soli TaxID=1638099 RepID=A0A5B2VBS1_9HYPH|nr:glycosyltransferase family 1 protein [Salinarimonas soli]KAA2235749.1 glycosyltransferase family 1 protein [Salinarimonas soli]